MKLTPPQRLELVSVSVLREKLPHVLARFEADLVEELRERALKLGDAAACTADEWRIVEDCAAALRAELAKHRTEMVGRRLMLIERGRRTGKPFHTISALCSP